MIHEGPLVWKVNRDKTIGRSDVVHRFWIEQRKENRDASARQSEEVRTTWKICCTVLLHEKCVKYSLRY